MATINNIKKRAAEIKDAYEPESVTAEKVGKLFEDIADVTEQAITSSEEVMQESVRASEQAAQAAEDASGYLANLQEAIQDLPDGQAVSAEVADHELRVSDLEANSATKEEVTSKYGDYSDISEFLDAKVDAEDHFLEGIAKDGTKVFGGNVDAPNIRQLDSDVTLAKTQAQEAASTAQQASERVAGMVEDVEDAVSQAGSALQQTEQLSQDVVEKYGDYAEISEYLNVVTDSDGHLLEATKKDGTKVFFGGVESPEIKQQATQIEELQETTEWFDKIIDAEWSQLTVDSDDRIIWGITSDGTMYVQKIESPSIDALVKKKVNEVVSNPDYGVILRPSSFLPNEIRTRKYNIELPDLSSINLSLVVVNTQEEFDKVLGISPLSQGDELPVITDTNVLMILNTDVKINTVKNENDNGSLPSGRTLVINGNGHTIVGIDKEYTATTINGDRCYCAYDGVLTGFNLFVSPNGEVLRLARTKAYTAAGEILAAEDIKDINNNTIFEEGDVLPTTVNAFGDYTVNGTTYHCDADTVYHCKFKLPVELSDLVIASTDNVYVNITTSWSSVQCKVTGTQVSGTDTYLYFDYVYKEKDAYNNDFAKNELGINNDGDIKASFYLINLRLEDEHSCLIKTIEGVDTLIFPSAYPIIGESNRPLFKMYNRYINLKICNADMVGYQIVANTQFNCNVILDKCKLRGCCTRVAVSLAGGSRLFAFNNEVCDCDQGGFNVGMGDNSELVAVGNNIHNIGLRRSASNAIEGRTKYYIAHNVIYDFGYQAIWGGHGYMSVYRESRGIIEYNTIYQTKEYFMNAKHLVPKDGGAIYLPTNRAEGIVRHNIICGYTGRSGNKGIYCDDGCYNIYVYSNIIANTPNSYAISARYVESDNSWKGIPYTLDNTYKFILNNYVENSIQIVGRSHYPNDEDEGYQHEDGEVIHTGEPLEDNHCYFGCNIFNARMQTVKNEIKNIAANHQENQYTLSISSYQGCFSTTLDVVNWLNKL